jgi:thiamine pyrophosphate-dependent acetolactate synthase large subunit-like protein
VTHLFNGLMDARKEGAAVIAIAGDVESKLIDTSSLEELNPYKFFDAALYIGRIVNPAQARAVINTAITTAVIDRGPTVISLPGDGGFTMLALGDLATLVQRKARVVHVILNNESLDFVNIEQQEAGFVPFGVEFKNPNFARVAEAMGAKGIRLEEPGDMKEALTEALAYEDGPVVVDAVVDPYALSLPSHVPLHTAAGYTLSLTKQVLAGRFDDVIKTMERNVRLV